MVFLGPATTFCAVTAAGEYLGGAIAPGLRISADALFNRAAKLPKIELLRPKTAIGPDTVTSMQSGLIFGYAGLADELVRRIQQAQGRGCFVAPTGGPAGLSAPESRTIREVRPHL